LKGRLGRGVREREAGLSAPRDPEQSVSFIEKDQAAGVIPCPEGAPDGARRGK